jgi:murein DD-endopeptidase MepM/ murein hydrolase activator NlpD
MIDKFSRLGERLFPERQILVRSRGEVTHITLPGLLQAAVVGVSLVGAAALGVTTLWPSTGGDTVAVEALKSELALAKQAADAAGARLHEIDIQRRAHGELADSIEAAAAVDVATLTDRVKQLEGNLYVASHQSAENRSLYEHAVAQLEKLTNEDKRLKADHEKLAAEKGKLQSKVGELEVEKDKAERSVALEREKLKQKVAELDLKMQAKADRNPGTVAMATPGAVPSDQKQVASAEGFDLDKFLGNFGVGMKRGGVGGPYVALNGSKDDPKADETARRVISTLPLTAPLDTFQLESRFGVRQDPFNGHQAVHSGLDLSAPYRTPVYNTSPGTVVFAGYAAAYGKVVEIDHGMGIHTKYAHLNRITVNVGQKLTRKSQIGLLGSTGRSTGPHVHYEVLVNGVAQDPEKFLQAGKSIALVKASK